jgi:hypothetical protein
MLPHLVVMAVPAATLALAGAVAASAGELALFVELGGAAAVPNATNKFCKVCALRLKYIYSIPPPPPFFFWHI